VSSGPRSQRATLAVFFCQLYSLVLTYRQCSADPEAYIEDWLMRVATTPASETASLKPWTWQVGRGKTPSRGSVIDLLPRAQRTRTA
jgi:hypothetical protein